MGFEAISQALASAHDLADDATEEGKAENDIILSLILPILVVPDGVLWQTHYQTNGERKDDPVQTSPLSSSLL